MKELLKASLAYAMVAGSAILGVRVVNDMYDKVKNRCSTLKRKTQ